MKIIFAILLICFLQSINAERCDCGKNKGFHFSFKTGKCETLQKGDTGYVYNCYQYYQDIETRQIACKTCITGFAVDKVKNKCIKHELTNCKNPQYRGENRIECIDGCENGYVLNKSNQHCEKPVKIIANCEKLIKENSVEKCEKCNTGYYKKDDGCEKNPETGGSFVSNCEIYEWKSGAVKCESCQKGFYFNPKANTCVDISDSSSRDEFYVSNCSQYMFYEGENIVKCVECKDSFILYFNPSLGKRQCIPNPTSGQQNYKANCAKYESSGIAYRCTDCAEGYYSNDSGDCVAVPSVVNGCYQYYKEGSNVVCGGCKSGLFSIDNFSSCNTCPVVSKAKPMPLPEIEPEEKKPENSGGRQLQFCEVLVFVLMIFGI